MKIRIPCHGTVIGSAASTSEPWVGLCERCNQTVPIGTAVGSAAHEVELDLTPSLAGYVIESGLGRASEPPSVRE